MTLGLSFVGRRFQIKYCRIHHAIASTILEAIKKNMASISKVIRLSQKLRGIEPSMSTLCLGFVGHILVAKSIDCVVCVSTRYQPF